MNHGLLRPVAARPPAAGVDTRDGRREVARVTEAGAVVVAGRDLADVRGDLWRLGLSMIAVGLVASGAAALGGWVIAASAVRPLRRIGDTARAMSAGDFDARIPVERIETELGQIAHTLNEAFDRLQAALARQRRFTADASHELRTPLATISTELQWTLARDRSPDDYRQSLSAMKRAAARMQAIVERLLALARAEASADAPEAVGLDEVTQTVVADLETLAARKDITLHAALTPVTVRARATRLPQRAATTRRASSSSVTGASRAASTPFTTTATSSRSPERSTMRSRASARC